MILVRVSSKEQELEGFSLEAQERYLRDYCSRVGLKVAKVFFISESASKVDQRQTFNEAVAYLKKHRIRHFICEKVDRLLRNFRDVVMVEDWLAAEEARRLHCPKNSLVLHKNSSSQDKFVWGMHVVVAKNYSDNLSEEVRKGMLEKLRQGWLPRTPPPGYENVTVDGKRVQRVVPEVAALVVRLFQSATNRKHTLKSLAEESARLGLLNAAGKTLSRNMVHRMLRNPFYAGVIRWDGKVYPGSHDPIISMELFEQVQSLTSRQLQKAPSYRKHLPLFKGAVACSNCRRILWWETQKGHWYGRCGSPRKCGRKHLIREEKVEEQVLARLEELRSPSPNLLTWLRSGLESVMAEELASLDSSRKKIRENEDRLQQQTNILYDDRLEGRITAEQYDAKAAVIHADKVQLKKQLAQLEAGDTSFLRSGLSFLELTQSVAKEYRSSTDVTRKRELVDLLFDSLVLDDDHLVATYNRRAQWVLAEISPIRLTKTGELQPSNNGSAKQKRAHTEAPCFDWLGVRDMTRTLFS